MHISDIFTPEEFGNSANMADISFDRLETDPNRIHGNCLFFLINGVFENKKNVLPFVFAKKPAAVVVEDETVTNGEIPIVTVKNVRRAFAFACYRFFHADKLTFPLLAVTGTNGKTTVATEIVKIMEAKGWKVGYIGTGKITIGDNTISDPFYAMTTPDPPLLFASLEAMQYEGCDVAVMEISSHALALDKVAPLSFAVSVFTGLSEEHLDFHKDMESYYQAKKKLMDLSKICVINIDNPYGKRWFKECQTKKISVSQIENSDVKATAVSYHGLRGASFLYEGSTECFPLRISLPGDFQINNILLAATVALTQGVDVKTIQSISQNMPTIPGRMEKIVGEPTVFLDYAHTPDSLKTALEILNRNKIIGQKIILVFGCGGERDRSKRPLMASIAEKYADYFYITSDNARGENPLQIFKDIESGCQSDRHKSVYSRERAIYMAIENAGSDDWVLIEGKGDEPYIKDRTGIHPYDERKVIESALKKRKKGAPLFYENSPFDADASR